MRNAVNPEYHEQREVRETAAWRWFPSRIYLVDVSGWQRPHLCDWWAAWRHGCVGAYVKRSQGRKPTESGRDHAARMADSPVARGDYHFVSCRTRKDVLHPELQADVFCREIGDLQLGDLAPAIDYEGLSGTIEYPKSDWIDAFSDHVERCLGVRPRTIYTQWWLKGLVKDAARSGRYALWLAAGGGDPRVKLDPHTLPTVAELDSRWARGKYVKRCPVPSHWPEWALHQHVGHLPWYRDGRGKIDRNIPRHWLATVAQLRVGG